MAVSKRLRYEILRRDNYACRYCGAKAPDVHLTVDHVIPTALGGRDDPENLVTACVDCNTGKSSTPIGAEIVRDVRADALRWAQAMHIAARMQEADTKSRLAYIEEFDRVWSDWHYEDGSLISRPPEWASYVGRLHDEGLEARVLHALVNDVLPRRIADDRMWRYFCGAVRNLMAERVNIAEQIIRDQEEL